ncbi:MAG: thioredoxin reductase [Arenicella sp.]|jgi:thioredoxin reductase
MLDTIVIGAGPAGIQASYFLKQRNISHKILEKNNFPGSFYARYPRHRKLISINKCYTGSTNSEFNLRHDWNSLLSNGGPRFTDYDKELFPSADSLLKYLADFVDKENIDISYNSEVSVISKKNDIFTVELSDGQQFLSKNLIIATGFNRTNKPAIKGIEYAVDYSVMSINKEDYINKRVLIIGKGNSAFETADHLAGVASVIHVTSPTPLKLAWESHYVGNLRAVNNNIIDMYQLKSQHGIIDGVIESICKKDEKYQVDISYIHAEGEKESLLYDEILCCAGFKLDSTIFDISAMPETAMNGKYPVLSNSYESANVPGLYFAGTLTHASDFRKGTSGFIHGFRYNTQALVNILSRRLKDVEIPFQTVANDSDVLTKYLIDRFNVVSSIWQQPRVLAEVLCIEENNVLHYEALPVEYAVDEYFENKKILLVTFEYGDVTDGGALNQNRIARDNFDNSQFSHFLHPVLRYYNQGTLQEEFHVIEDLEAVWTIEEHYQHIFEFTSKVLELASSNTVDRYENDCVRKAV